MNESGEQPNMHDESRSSMPLQLGATMVDLKSDLEWLNPSANFERDFGLLNERTDGGGIVGRVQNEPTRWKEVVEGDDETMATDMADANDRNSKEGMRRNGSLPELDSGYQTSDSGLSIPEDLAIEHLTPAQTMLNLLPVDIDGRFGSFYSDANGPRFQKLPEQTDAKFIDEDMCRSRFSWGSSVYSDAGLSSVSDGDVWWKPIQPLVVNKETPPPPPVPQRNPLRLLKRLSKNPPKGFGENVRGSRNIHNLHLDLSRLSKGEVRNSLRSSTSGRRRSQTPVTKERSKRASKEARPNIAISGHILNAMRNSEQSIDGSNKFGDHKKVRWSTRTSTTSKAHRRNHPIKDAVSRSEYAEQLMGGRGHTRAISDPLHNGGTRSGNFGKWNASMPSHGCIRRSCIPSLVNKVDARKPAQALAINKKLPPLPVAMETS